MSWRYLSLAFDLCSAKVICLYLQHISPVTEIYGFLQLIIVCIFTVFDTSIDSNTSINKF